MPSADESSALLRKQSSEASSGFNFMGFGYGSTAADGVEMSALDGSHSDDSNLSQRMYSNLTGMIRSIHHTVNADKSEEIQILTEAREGQVEPANVGPRSPPHIKGYDRSHMVIEHGDHIGILVDGKMQCFERGDYDLENLCFDCQSSISDLRNCCTDAKPDGPCHIYANVVPCTQTSGSVALRRATSSCNIHSMLPSPKGEPTGGRMSSMEGDEHFDYVALNDQDKLEFHRMHLLPDGLKRIDVRGAVDSVPDEATTPMPLPVLLLESSFNPNSDSNHHPHPTLDTRHAASSVNRRQEPGLLHGAFALICRVFSVPQTLLPFV